MAVSGPQSGNVMQKADVTGMHQTLRTLVNDLSGDNLGRSSLNYEHLGSLVKMKAHADVTTTVTINADPAPFAQTAANIQASWQEPAQYNLNTGWVIPKPFLLVEYLTLDIYQFTATPALGDSPFWWTIYEENSGGVANVQLSHIRFIQGQNITEAGSGATIRPKEISHVHTLVRRQLYTGTGDFTLNKISLRAVVADWRGVGQPVDIRGGCIGFYALHVPN